MKIHSIFYVTAAVILATSIGITSKMAEVCDQLDTIIPLLRK